jgi:DNA replication protein DnaC
LICHLPKQQYAIADEQGNEIWDRTNEYQHIREIEHNRIRKHFQDLTDEETADYETCDFKYHWRHVGIVHGLHSNRSYSDIAIGLCPDFVEKNPDVAAHSSFKHDAVVDQWQKLEQPQADSEAFANARRFKGSIAKTLIITGACGYGKTTLAKAVMADYTRAGEETCFITCEKLTDVFLACKSFNNEIDLDARQTKVDMRNADLLVLDDLGNATKEYTEDFKKELKQLLDEKRGKLIITTNLDKRQMESKFNAQIVSRIFERVRVVHLKGKDYRRS